MKSTSRKRTIAVSPDKLFEILTSEEFEIKRQKNVNMALDADIQNKKEDEKFLSYEVHATEYSKGIKGIDKTKTDHVITKYVWNKEAKTGEWSWHGPYGNKVISEGKIIVKPNGDGADLINELSVDIKIPLIGGQIEKKVVKEVESSWTKYDEVLDSFL